MKDPRTFSELVGFFRTQVSGMVPSGAWAVMIVALLVAVLIACYFWFWRGRILDTLLDLMFSLSDLAEWQIRYWQYMLGWTVGLSVGWYFYQYPGWVLIVILVVTCLPLLATIIAGAILVVAGCP